MSIQSILKRTVSAVRRFSSRIFVSSEDETTVEIVAALREVDLFKSLTRRQLVRIASAFHRRHYKRGEVVYYQGDPGLGLYVIEQGSVALSVESDGENIASKEIGQSQTFGVVSMFGDVSRHESATASTQTSLLGLFSPELKALVRRNPTIGAALLHVIAEHLAETHSAGHVLDISSRGTVTTSLIQSGQSASNS